MNKAHWLSVALDETVDNEKIKFLVDMRYELTKKEEVSNHFLFFLYQIQYVIAHLHRQHSLHHKN